MDKKIFISYRRFDKQGTEHHTAQWLDEGLRKHFGDNVFFDRNQIKPGDTWPQTLLRGLAEVNVLLALIDKPWLDQVARLEDETDWVREEIRTALQRPDIRFLPILFGGAQLPKRFDAVTEEPRLPAVLSDLLLRQALPITTTDPNALGKIVQAIKDEDPLFKSRPEIAYYRTIAWRFNVPEGVGPQLSEPVRRGRRFNYCIVRSGGRVRELRIENHAGILQDDPNETGVAQRKFYYYDNGELSRIDVFDRDGVQKHAELYDGRHTIDFRAAGIPKDVGGGVSAAEAFEDGAVRGVTGVTRYALNFDEHGHQTEVRFRNHLNEPRRDAGGSFGVRTSYTKDGLPIRTEELNERGEPAAFRGLFARVLEYDEYHCLKRQTFVDDEDRPVDSVHGYAVETRDYDQWGNEIEVSFWRANGEPALCKDGWRRARTTYEHQPRRITLRYYGLADERTVDATGVSGFRQTLNERGNVELEEYLGLDDKPTIHRDGHAGLRQQFNDRDHEIVRQYIDENGEPTLCSAGYASFHQEYDNQGRRAKICIFRDVAGKPTICKEGYHGFERRYDQDGRLREVRYLDHAFNLTRNSDGIACLKYDYDRWGNISTVTFSGPDGAPIICARGYAGYEQKFNEHGNLVEFLYLGLDGKPKTQAEGVAGFRSEHDAFGAETRRAYVGPRGEPAQHRDGYAGYTQTFSPLGKRETLTYLDAAGAPVRCRDGYASYRASHNARGERVEVNLLGPNGEPAEHQEGYAAFRDTFDDFGRKIATDYFGMDGAPKALNSGVARVTYAYDARGRETQRSFFGANGEPAPLSDGYSATQTEYDNRGNPVRFFYLDAAGRPTIPKALNYAGLARSFDLRGNVIAENFLGVDERPVANLRHNRSFYDARDNLVRHTYVDHAGQPALSAENFCTRLYKFADDALRGIPGGGAGNAGAEIECAYFDAEDQPCAHPDGYHGYTRQFDAAGRCVELAYFGPDRRLTTDKNGCSGKRWDYDELGNVVRETLLRPKTESASQPASPDKPVAPNARDTPSQAPARKGAHLGLVMLLFLLAGAIAIGAFVLSR
jgi:hypothetical protein